MLTALLGWATTVVKLPRDIAGTEWLSDDFAEFPAEFLLFSSHVAQLTLEDRVSAQTRSISTQEDGTSVIVTEGDNKSTWSVFRTDIETAKLGKDAREDAVPKTRERDRIPLLWAVPHQSKKATGQFWAFFPTETETSLAGILNAPWKTNADRQNLLDGAFNRALINEAVALAGRSLPRLIRDSDPGYLVEILPARAADAVGWADKALIALLESSFREIPCVPDETGDLRIPTQLRMRPDAAVSDAIRKTLSSLSLPLSREWIHSSVERRDRRAKAERLGVERSSINEWLGSLAPEPSVTASTGALKVVEVLLAELPSQATQDLRYARVILTNEKSLVSASDEGLSIGQDDELTSYSGTLVHSKLAAKPDIRQVLSRLGVRELTARAELERRLKSNAVDWDLAWQLLRKIPLSDAGRFAYAEDGRREMFVRTLAETFAPPYRVFLPGVVVPADGTRDAPITVDVGYHSKDSAYLDVLGITAAPVLGRDADESIWYRTYLKEARAACIAELRAFGEYPDRDYLEFRATKTAGPMDPLGALSLEGGLILTHLLSGFISAEQPWYLSHRTRPKTYRAIPFDPPIKWMLKRAGTFNTSLGPRKASDIVGTSMADWRELLPVADLEADVASALDIPLDVLSLRECHWNDAWNRIDDINDEAVLGMFYSCAAELQSAPSTLRCRIGDVFDESAIDKIFVTADLDTARVLQESASPFVRTASETAASLLADEWQLQRCVGSLRFVARESETPLIDAYPGIRRFLEPPDWALQLQVCERIWTEFVVSGSTVASALQLARSGDSFCATEQVTRAEVLSFVATELKLDLTPDQLYEILNHRSVEDARRRIAEADINGDLSEKLALLIGADALYQGLPSGVQALLASQGTADTEADIAQTALSVYGVEVLAKYSAVLESLGFDPPSRWSGSPRAQEFVDELGFPVEYAGFQQRRLDPSLEVEGPLHLKPLHDFQVMIGQRIKDFLVKPKPTRGLLSLPTGSGKTRVVVQAVVEAMASGSFSGSVIWIAQSEELCEQAVQSWAEIWRAYGPATRLRISRLWGATNNRVVEAADPHIVVATYQSLKIRLQNQSYAWIRRASCVIIDEAHGATAPSYTEILGYLGIDKQDTERPLVGITATPFRSSINPEETQWLVNRFGRHRFDHDVLPGDDPYSVLQDRGILAKVDQIVIPGEELELSAQELTDLKQFKTLPPSVEARLGGNQERNERIAASIAELESDWPVLLFATSVEHANLMAAILCMKGLSARAISGETDRGARRHYIEEFRRGNIRVLSNFNVLSTGFDAPSLRALYIARPVYSPVLYQQMIGRGLRGPSNGGKDRCLVVNVNDNIAQFGEKLAFHHFEYLWSESNAS